MPDQPATTTPHPLPVPRHYTGSSSGRPNLSRERIRQIETIAMRKFQRELVKRGIRKSDLLA